MNLQALIITFGYFQKYKLNLKFRIFLFHFPVARKILELKKHQVDLGGECSITVEARPVHLMLPKLVEVKQTTTANQRRRRPRFSWSAHVSHLFPQIDSEVSSQRILISNLPRMETETLVDKLEIHFSKTKNGGGEVADCEYLSDSETVVLTFAENSEHRIFYPHVTGQFV